MLQSRSDNHGVLNVRGQDSVSGSSPSTSRYLNLNHQDFRLYLGMGIVLLPEFIYLLLLWLYRYTSRSV